MTKSQKSPPPTQRTPRFARYRRSETARLLKGAADAGHLVRGLEVDPVTGALRILFGKPESGGNDFDRWMADKK
jgi:hypothetical protein